MARGRSRYCRALLCVPAFEDARRVPHRARRSARARPRRRALPDEVRVVYVSPLKALSADIHKNLAEPRARHPPARRGDGLEAPRITAAVRTGDTTQAERAAMLRTPPHILVTTPESLYLLLTAERSRADAAHRAHGHRRRDPRGDRHARGAHLALSLERLQQVAERRCSASACRRRRSRSRRSRGLLVGERRRCDCAIVDEGPPPRDGSRRRDAAVAARRGDVARGLGGVLRPAGADRSREHRTTLVFVNTRRMAERVARHLSERLGDDAVTAHHGSLSKEKRLDAEHAAEERAAEGARRDRVARARHRHRPRRSRLPDRLAAPDRHAAAARRPLGPHDRRHAEGPAVPGVARRSRRVRGAAARGPPRRARRHRPHDAPLDVLAQQIVAETRVPCDYGEDELFALVRAPGRIAISSARTSTPSSR